MIRNQRTNRLVKFGGSHYKDLAKRQTADPSRRYFLKKDVDRLRRRLIRGGGDDEDLDTCPICLDNEEENPHMIAVWPCGHLFCEMCIREYCFGKKLCVCPTCRGTIKEPSKLLNEQRRPESWGEAEVIRMSNKDKERLLTQRLRKEAAKSHHYKRYELFFNMYMDPSEIQHDSLRKHAGPFIESITRTLLAKNEAVANHRNVPAMIFSIVYSINDEKLKDRPEFRKVLVRRERRDKIKSDTVWTYKLDVVFKFDAASPSRSAKQREHVSRLVKTVRDVFDERGPDAALRGSVPFWFDLVKYTLEREWGSNDLDAMVRYLRDLHRDYEIKKRLLLANERLKSLRLDVERLDTREGDRAATAKQLEEYEIARKKYLEEADALRRKGRSLLNVYTLLIKEDDDTYLRREIARLTDMQRRYAKGKAVAEAEAEAGPSGARNHTVYTEYALRVDYAMIFNKIWLNEEMRSDLNFAKSLQNHVEAADTLERSHILIRINGRAHHGVFVHSFIIKKRRAAAPLSDVVSKGWRDYLNTEGANPNMHARVLMTFNVELVLGCKLVDQGEREIALSRALGDLSVSRADTDALFSDASRVGFRYVFDMAENPETVAQWTSNDDLAVNAHVRKLVAATKEKSGALNFYHRPRSL